MEELKRRKEQMEKDAYDSADIVLAAPSNTTKLERKRAYFGERVSIESEKKKRRMAGNDWEVHIDDRTKRKYWYHTLTHQCTWEKPILLVMKDTYDATIRSGFSLCPPGILRYIFTFLSVQPDILSCRAVCHHCTRVADHQSLWYRVLTQTAYDRRLAILAGGEDDDVWGSNWVGF